MSTDRQQDAGLDRLLRAALEPAAPVSGNVCPEADVIAAYAEGGLTARERTELEPHMADCSRCQSVLAMMTRDAVADADNRPARLPAWRAWLSLPRLGWLVPASAAAIAIVLYVAVKPEPAGLGDQRQPTAAAVPAPESTVAQFLDQASPTAREKTAEPRANAAPTLRQTAETPARTPADAKSAAGKTEPRQPPAATGIQARAEVGAVPIAAVPPPAPAATAVATDARTAALVPARAAVPGDLAMVSPTQERQKSGAAMGAAREADKAVAHDAGQQKGIRTVGIGNVVPASGLEGLWSEADFVVHARAMATQSASIQKGRVGQDAAASSPNLATDFVVLEVFKRHDTIPPTERFVVTRTGGEAETMVYHAADWATYQAGAEYVLFLKRMSPTDHTDRLEVVGHDAGIYRLDGDHVVIGTGVNREPLPLRADLLARLRQFAGTARRDR